MAKRTRKTNFTSSKRHALFFFLIYIVGALILTFEKQFVAGLFPNLRCYSNSKNRLQSYPDL